ncbi:glycosyltransferase involved in cell wall biosynthesis [Actinoplanes octamycinicus]|uniref:Glycosyltransferase involved in cell wall biosynthesis n=1 Tax=Actinoplanes octamycinicus TaxID=135948 RepID=A0A7W7M586_9ACTN|nr:glycosyltransferase family 2 protein [Actinoplanes octamycinicus]MBB4737479.1 glycosyltransferase involved in cell wall biosynthesis [Actinoplanes octamycinicus]
MTVVVAVYNTMPYLTECLESILGQTIGPDRLQVIAVDDGSTDGGGAELDAWAARYPDTVLVLRQPNSGGPAGPSNRALDRATGRYVFFVGADDRLGPEALERLVGAADETGADIVLGRLVGAGGRKVDQRIFAAGDRDAITLADSPLAWALSNTKLFRRALLEEHRIRFPEDMASCSDQPFTIRAVLAARRIAVRTGYEFYYAVRRTDASNITFRTPPVRLLQDTTLLLARAADLVSEPRARHNLLVRHFSWEVGKLLGKRFLSAGPDDRETVHQGVRKLADAYLTEAARRDLPVRHRAAISVAQYGTADDVLALARHYAEHRLRPAIADRGRYYVAFPGFRAPGRGFPDEWFDATAEAIALDRQDGPATLGWGRCPDGRPALLLRWPTWIPRQDGEPAPAVQVRRGPSAPAELSRATAAAAIPVDDLVRGESHGRFRDITFRRGARRYPVTASDVSAAGRRLHRLGGRLFLVGVVCGPDGRVGVEVRRITVRRMAARLRRTLVRG